MPIILIAEEADRPRVVRGLDLGVNDFIMRPVERNELAARVRTQIRRHRYAVELRRSVTNTMALAVTDELTGLYNRRYFDRHLTLMLDKAREQDRDMAVMLIDMDFFKAVNDTHGHDIGDAVLREFSQRLRRNIRGVDLACRFGGEEFVVLMPDTDFRQAQAVAERVRMAVAEKPFEIERWPASDGHLFGGRGAQRARGRYPRNDPEACRCRPLPGQTRRPQPRGLRRRLTVVLHLNQMLDR